MKLYTCTGVNKLRQITEENHDADFVLWNGSRAQIKRTSFEKYIDNINYI